MALFPTPPPKKPFPNDNTFLQKDVLSKEEQLHG